jgi:uncharacterized repeat protein (TIGR01451 family)
MTSQRHAATPLMWRVLAVLAATLAGLLAFTVARADAVPGTQEWTGEAAGSTPDIEITGLTFRGPDGDPITAGSIAGTLNFTLDGVARVGYCIDTARSFDDGVVPVDFTVEDPPSTAERRAVTWILLNRTPTDPTAPGAAEEAAAAQIAIWLLLGQVDPDEPVVGNTLGLNDAAFALRDEALAATATPSSLGISIAPPAAGATTATVTVTGKPGATVSLAVTAGTGSLSATSLTIGAGGTATATLTSPGPGSVTVQAGAAGDGRLILIEPSSGESQATSAAEATQIVAAAQVAFQAAPVTPVTPVVAIAQAPRPRLAITKTAPTSARVLQRVRYRITVRNTGRVTARNVVLQDRIPSGLSVVSTSRRGTLRNGTITFQLGTLRAGQSRTVTVWLVANASVRGTRVNVATVSANRVRPLRARAATAFRPLARRVQPAVTG